MKTYVIAYVLDGTCHDVEIEAESAQEAVDAFRYSSFASSVECLNPDDEEWE